MVRKLIFASEEGKFTGWVSTALSDCVTRCVGRVSQGLSVGLNSSGQCGGWLRSNRVWSERNQPHTASTLWYGALSGFSNSPCQRYRPAIAPGTRAQWSPLSNESAHL